jgi:DNA repair photolyase
MRAAELYSKSLLRKSKKIDSWFVSRYGMNLYRGCAHNCVYCDGRAEGYYVEGEFGVDIGVKVNALELLQRELDPQRRRIPLARGYVFVGGGVGDSYQPAEARYQLTRRVLQLLLTTSFPVHVLTKSALVERDIGLLAEINAKNRAIVSFSFSSADDALSHILEPGAASPSERLRVMAAIKRSGIACGMYLLPVVPCITDAPRLIEDAFVKAQEAGADFAVCGGMTLKDGRQKEHFYGMLRSRFPQHLAQYDRIYIGDRRGEAGVGHCGSLGKLFAGASRRHGIPLRIPPRLYGDLLPENDVVVVMLEQIDYLLRMQGRQSPFGYAGYAISKVNEPLCGMLDRIAEMRGVGEMSAGVIREIIQTRRSLLLERLLYGGG